MRSTPPLLFVVVVSTYSCLYGMNAAAQAPAQGQAQAQDQAQAPDAAWPHAMTVNGASVVVYQPQAIDWPKHETLTTREAIAITPPGAKTPILGTTEIAF